MELSNRLQAVADLLDCHEAIADIGCDHGFVSIYLIESKKASRVLAMDVNKGPLERAKEHVEEKRLSTYIETRLSDGAKAIEFLDNGDGTSKLEVQAALVAGMGGRLMIRIIQDSIDKFTNMDEFILQPQSEIPKVRQFIREIGYHIEKENMILEDGKYYPMMKVVKGKGNDINSDHIPQIIAEKLAEEKFSLQDLYDEYGEWLLKNRNEVLLQFLKFEKNLYSDILRKLKQTETSKGEVRQKEIEQKIRFIDLGLEWFVDEM